MTDTPITLEIIEGPDGPQADEHGWQHYAYTVRLDREDHQAMDVPWRQGLGITQDPTPRAVLEALLMDAATIENAAGDFEAWASELGFDPDSRKAYAIFEQATAQTEKLRALLGDDFDDAVFPGTDHEAASRRLAHAV